MVKPGLLVGHEMYDVTILADAAVLKMAFFKGLYKPCQARVSGYIYLP